MDGDLITRKDFAVLQEQLEHSIKLSQENNDILHAMRKWGRVAFVAKVIIWTVVLVVPVLLYPYIARYVPALSGTSTASSTGSGLFGYPSPIQIEKVLHPGG